MEQVQRHYDRNEKQLTKESMDEDRINIVPIVLFVVAWSAIIIGLVKSKDDPDEHHLFRDIVLVGMVVMTLLTLVALSR